MFDHTDPQLGEFSRIFVDELTKEQFYDLFQSGRTHPLKKLSLTVLWDAIRGLLSEKSKRNPGAQQHADLQWVFYTDRDSPFSFNNVCDTLGIDPGTLRKKVRAALDQKKVIKVPRRSPSHSGPRTMQGSRRSTRANRAGQTAG